MQEQNKSLSIIHLCLGGLKTANQAFGRAFLLSVLFALLSLVFAIISACLVFWQPNWGFGVNIVCGICSAIISSSAAAAIIQLLGQYWLQTRTFSLLDCFCASFRHGVFLWVSILIQYLALAVLGAVLFFGFFSKNLIVGLICYVILFILLLIPGSFTAHAIVFRGKGPCSGLAYSWLFCFKHCGKILLTFAFLIGVIVCGILAVLCLIKGFFPQQIEMAVAYPAALPMLLTYGVAKIHWLHLLGLGLLLLAISFYSSLTFISIMVGLFLNADDEYMEEYLETIPEVVLPQMGVQQTSIRVKEEDTFRQLDQVYSAQEHLPQNPIEEEDRMPTILFDDAMAQQLQQNEQQLQARKEAQARRTDEDNNQTIKISDKPL